MEAPEPGYLWTPGYWGWNDGFYIWNGGYWGPHVGFYGGVNYGYGYIGHGYAGGYWDRGEFRYNRAYNNMRGDVHITNVYNSTVINSGPSNRVSYTGGNGIHARPGANEMAAERDHHLTPVPAQQHHEEGARGNPELRASSNHGRPPIAATPRAGEFAGQGVMPARGAGAPHPSNFAGAPGHAAPAAPAAPAMAPRSAPETSPYSPGTPGAAGFAHNGAPLHGTASARQRRRRMWHPIRCQPRAAPPLAPCAPPARRPAPRMPRQWLRAHRLPRRCPRVTRRRRLNSSAVLLRREPAQARAPVAVVARHASTRRVASATAASASRASVAEFDQGVTGNGAAGCGARISVSRCRPGCAARCSAAG